MDLLAVTSLEATTGFTDDTVVNTFAFRTEANGLLAAELAALALHIKNFWTLKPADAPFAVGNYISPNIDRGATATCKLYDISGKLGLDPAKADAEHPNGKPFSHGSPIHASTFTVPAPIGLMPAPPQVALAITTRGNTALAAAVEAPGNPPIRPRARRSGRLFIGPLCADVIEAGTDGFARPIATFRNALLASCEQLQDGLNGAGATWAVWSRASGFMDAITSCEVDDSFDVIRSRKADAITRTKRVFAPVPLLLGA